MFAPFYRSGPGFDVSELESLFSATVSKPTDAGGKSGGRRKSVGAKADKVHLVILTRIVSYKFCFLKNCLAVMIILT